MKARILILLLSLFSLNSLMAQSYGGFSDYSDSGGTIFSMGMKFSGGINNLTGMDKLAKSKAADGMDSKTKGIIEVASVWQLTWSGRNFLQLEFDCLLHSTGVETYSDNLNRLVVRRTADMFGMSARIPLYFGRKFTVGHSMRVVIGAGPYIGFNMMESGEGTSVEDYFEMRGFQAGLSAMAGIEFQSVQILAGYDHGLTNVVKGVHGTHECGFKLGITFMYF